MRDSELVASIVAGEPAGLAAAYDRYAGGLFGYCRSLLDEPDDAADAVQDTFVIAASKLAGLREPDRLRSWLFAVARNECLRRLKSRQAAAPLQDAPEPADESADVGVAAERAETVALVRAAVAGLNDGERDVINQLWHGLEVPEVADVLGVSRRYAYTLFARAREQLEASVAVLLVGRSGRGDCAALDSLLGDWDGALTARLRRRVGRHIDRCLVCSDRRRRELTPAMLYGLTPGAVLAMTALRSVPGLAGGAIATARDGVLRIAAHAGSHAVARRAAAGHGTHSFGISGFPKPLHHGHLGFSQLPHLPFATAGGTTAVAATATAVVTSVVPPLGPGVVHARLGGAPAVSAAVAAVPAGAVPAGAVPAGAVPAGGGGDTAGTRSGPSALPVATGRGTARTVASGTCSPSAAPSGGPAGTGTPVSRLPTPGSTRVPAEATATPTTRVPTIGVPTAIVATGTPSPAPTATSSLSESPSGSPGGGTLTVSSDAVLLGPLLRGSLTLTANGGPVSWSVNGPASVLGSLAVSPSAGTLNAGQSVAITLTAARFGSLTAQLTVEPGDQPVTVLVALG
jgi:RNA polymerase sigma factor (sigma-70 family)